MRRTANWKAMRYFQGLGEGVPHFVPTVRFNPHPTGVVIQPNTTQARGVSTPVQSRVRTQRAHTHLPYCGCGHCGGGAGSGG